MILKNDRKNYIHDIGDFMTDYMEKVSDPTQKKSPFDYPAEELIFEKTFKILNHTLGDLAFSGTNVQGSFIATFLFYHYEAFTLALQAHLDKIDPYNKEVIAKLKEVLLSIKRDAEFRKMTTGGGKNTARRLQERIAFVEEKVGKAL